MNVEEGPETCMQAMCNCWLQGHTQRQRAGLDAPLTCIVGIQLQRVLERLDLELHRD